MSRVAVIGAGVMGNGIAHVFAQYGWDTALIDVSRDALDKALKTIETNLERQVKKGVGSGEWAVQTRGRIRTSTSPVEVHDSPGFVSNRVLLPMINEAIFCVLEGVATPEAIDTVMKLGMNHPLGPLALADLIGLDVCLAILEVLHRDLGDDKYRAAPLLRKMVAAGRLGRKSGRGFYGYRD